MTSTLAAHQAPVDNLAVVQSAIVPAGRRFEPTREVALHGHMLKVAADLGSRGRDLIAVPEFPGPFGIADLAVLATSLDRLSARIDAQVTPLVRELDAAIVSNLTPRRGMTADELARRLAIPQAQLDRRLAALIRNGAVSRSRAGKLVRHEALTPLGQIYSIESKISSWRSALDQARTYALWSDRSVAVLGELPRRRHQVIEAARSAGIGLTLQSEWLVRPRATELTPIRRFWTSEMFFAALGDLTQESFSGGEHL